MLLIHYPMRSESLDAMIHNSRRWSAACRIRLLREPPNPGQTEKDRQHPDRRCKHRPVWDSHLLGSQLLSPAADYSREWLEVRPAGTAKAPLPENLLRFPG